MFELPIECIFISYIAIIIMELAAANAVAKFLFYLVLVHIFISAAEVAIWILFYFSHNNNISHSRLMQKKSSCAMKYKMLLSFIEVSNILNKWNGIGESFFFFGDMIILFFNFILMIVMVVKYIYSALFYKYCPLFF